MMNNLEKEQAFFHFVAKAVSDFVAKRNKVLEITTHKREGDFATEVDVAVEQMIVDEIKKRFPTDEILAEEMSKDTPISDGRIWIIDPICGTNNLTRGIYNFCTNIALAENNELIASCVIDHSNGDYYWSVGDKKVFINDKLFEPIKRYDTYIEVDFGAVQANDKQQKEEHNRFLRNLVTENSFYLISLNTSLGFAYVAIGKVDGVFTIQDNPWDVAASIFLIRQAGGIVTDLEGNEWKLKANGMIAANDKELHQKLLKTYKKN